jgi:hypothetical protein
MMPCHVTSAVRAAVPGSCRLCLRLRIAVRPRGELAECEASGALGHGGGVWCEVPPGLVVGEGRLVELARYRDTGVRAYLINGKDARDDDYRVAIESLPHDDLDYVRIELPGKRFLVTSTTPGGFVAHHRNPNGSLWAVRSVLTKDEAVNLVMSFLDGGDAWRKELVWDQLIAPTRGGSQVERTAQLVARVASWCSWRCPLSGLILVIVARTVPSERWQAVLYTLTGAMILLLFASCGIAVSLGCLASGRPNRWPERLCRVCGILGGFILVALGLVGAWTLVVRVVLRR